MFRDRTFFTVVAVIGFTVCPGRRCIQTLPGAISRSITELGARAGGATMNTVVLQKTSDQIAPANLPANTRAANTSGATMAHDPSRMMLCDGKYYVYATGGGMKSSTDGVNWTSGPSPFAAFAPAAAPAAATPAAATPGRGIRRSAIPPSLKALVPVNQGIWAPDVIFYHNKYLLYYSVAAGTVIGHCAVGLLTSPTLDPSSPDYKWTDAGLVIDTNDHVQKLSAIDPGPFVDAQGHLWLIWGSGYGNGATWDDPTVVISKLDDTTGLGSTTDKKIYPVAPGHIEAGYAEYHAPYYYAFWNDGGCCNGVKSTYRIHVARSATVTGPYLDKAGKPVARGDVFMASVPAQSLYGPGHMGIENEPGLDRFTFHYYNADGRPVLGVRTLVWGADGWPRVGENLPDGTYKITTQNGLSLTVPYQNTADGAPAALLPYTGSDSQKWTVAVTPDGYYRLTSVGGTLKGSDQAWIIELLSDGKTYCLKSSANQQALGASDGGGGKTAGAIAISPWNDLPGQRWSFSAP